MDEYSVVVETTFNNWPPATVADLVQWLLRLPQDVKVPSDVLIRYNYGLGILMICPEEEL